MGTTIGTLENPTDVCPSVPFNSTKYFKIPIYSLVLVAGLPLNCLALWALVSQIKRSVVISVYITNLVLANLLQTLTLPFWMYYSYHNHVWDLGKWMCAVAGLAFRTNFYAKNTFLCLIAMERYVGLVHPLKLNRLQTIQGAFKFCTAIWLLVAALCATGIWLQMDPLQSLQEQSQSKNHCLDAASVEYAQFKVATIIFYFIIPLLLMGFFYFRVLFELRKVESLERKAKRQIYIFVSLIIASFFVLFVPFQVTSCYTYYVQVFSTRDNFCNLERKIFIYVQTTLCLTTLGNIVDPLLYILLLKDVRAEFKGIFSSRACKKGIVYSQRQDLPPCSSATSAQEQIGTQEVSD